MRQKIEWKQRKKQIDITNHWNDCRLECCRRTPACPKVSSGAVLLTADFRRLALKHLLAWYFLSTAHQFITIVSLTYMTMNPFIFRSFLSPWFHDPLALLRALLCDWIPQSHQSLGTLAYTLVTPSVRCKLQLSKFKWRTDKSAMTYAQPGACYITRTRGQRL